MSVQAKEGDLRKLATREARRDGIYAGLTSALAGALVGSRLMGFNRNKTIFCGVLTGLLSSYFFTQAFEASQISRINATQSALLGEYHQLHQTPAGPDTLKHMKPSAAEKIALNMK